MMDSASPLSGWSLPDVLSTDCGPATNDLYGKLFYHVSNHLEKFHHRLHLHKTDFNFLNVDARVLKDHLKGQKFSRIEVRSEPCNRLVFGTWQ